MLDIKGKKELFIGIPKLDKYINSFNTAEISIIGGRILTGKTFLASTIARNIVLNNEVKVGFFNFELDCFSYNSTIYNKNEEEKLVKSKLFIENCSARTLLFSELLKKIVELVSEKNVEVIIINTVQYITCKKGLNIIKALYKIATKLNISIIIFSNLKRNIEYRKYPKEAVITDLNTNFGGRFFNLAKPAIKYASNIMLLYFEDEFYRSINENEYNINIKYEKINGLAKKMSTKIFRYRRNLDRSSSYGLV